MLAVWNPTTAKNDRTTEYQTHFHSRRFQRMIKSSESSACLLTEVRILALPYTQHERKRSNTRFLQNAYSYHQHSIEPSYFHYKIEADDANTGPSDNMEMKAFSKQVQVRDEKMRVSTVKRGVCESGAKPCYNFHRVTRFMLFAH